MKGATLALGSEGQPPDAQLFTVQTALWGWTPGLLLHEPFGRVPSVKVNGVSSEPECFLRSSRGVGFRPEMGRPGRTTRFIIVCEC